MRASLPTLAAIALATLSLLAMGAVADECNGKPYGTAGQFDFYVFAQSWPAEFCYAHSSWPGCQNPTAWQKVNLTLHGMWPNYNQPQQGHGWPQCCPSAYGSDIDPAVVSALLPDLQTYWPNEQNPNPTGSGLGNSLWQHEWGKHGTCSGLPQKQYMMTAMGIELNIGTPAVLSNNVGGSAQLSDIQAAFNATGCSPNGPCWAAFQCSGSYFAGITTCWDQQLNQIMCPAAVLSSQGQQCSGSTVQISSF